MPKKAEERIAVGKTPPHKHLLPLWHDCGQDSITNFHHTPTQLMRQKRCQGAMPFEKQADLQLKLD
jgi:hypothetical protein